MTAEIQYNVYTDDGSGASFVVDEADSKLIDAAMRAYALDKTDQWLSVSGPGGHEVNVLASRIVGTMRTTPDQRRTATFRDKALEDERKELRREAGYIGDEE